MDTLVNCLLKAGFETVKLDETSEDDERIDDPFCKLLSRFPVAVSHEVSATDFVEVDCIV